MRHNHLYLLGLLPVSDNCRIIIQWLNLGWPETPEFALFSLSWDLTCWIMNILERKKAVADSCWSLVFAFFVSMLTTLHFHLQALLPASDTCGRFFRWLNLSFPKSGQTVNVVQEYRRKREMSSTCDLLLPITTQYCAQRRRKRQDRREWLTSRPLRTHINTILLICICKRWDTIIFIS